MSDGSTIDYWDQYVHSEAFDKECRAQSNQSVVKLLDKRAIQLTSVDLARFRWQEQNADGSSETVTSHVTIWVGVLPDSLTGDVAFESSNDILQLLGRHNILDIDIAYRESVTKLLAGPELSAPVNDYHTLKDVIDSVTTALSLPIAGLKTPHMQGTLGFFFQVGEALYGVTARHILFPEEQGNNTYSYVAGPKNEVVLMGNKGFDDFLASIQARIGTLNNTVIVLDKRVETYTRKVQAGNEQAASDLATTEADMNEKRAAIKELKTFFVKMKKEWSVLNDRVIGHVVWAPPIGVSTPHGYTKDVCVIRLDEKKFLHNFKGNVIDLGPEIESGDFMTRMYPRDDVQSEFDYPEDRLFRLDTIISAAKIRETNSQDRSGDPVRYVIKRGATTRTTIGRLTGFESHERRYSVLGNFDSVEVAIYPYDNESGPFSKGGDSGALIAGSLAEFIALLTGGTGLADSSDIIYGTPMHWLWDAVIRPRFPGANPYLNILDN